MSLKRKTPLLRTIPASEPKPAPGPRMRKCAICRTLFPPRSMTHKACSKECAEVFATLERQRKERKADRERKQSIKTRQQWLREAQAVFNSYIRERDAKDPCISCKRYHTGAYDAGHFRSVGAQPALRFEELNVHKQCVPCNQHKAGNIVEYRLNLRDKIGEDMLNWLEQDHPPVKYTIEQAKKIKEKYREKLREIRKNHEQTV